MINNPTKAARSDTAQLDMAIKHYSSGNRSDAKNLFIQILKTDSNNITAQTYIGLIASENGHFEAAIKYLTNAEKHSPGDFMRLFHLAYCYRQLNMPTQAVELIEKSLQANPNHTPSYVLHGDLLVDLNLTERAVINYQQAIAIDPNNPAAYLGLSFLLKHDLYQFSKTEIERLREMSQSKDQSKNNLSQSNFAMFRILHKAKNIDAAFAHLKIANLAKKLSYKKDHSFQAREHQQLLQQTQSIFSKHLLTQLADAGHPSNQPVFIIGMPRTGSTLVEKILAGHDAIHTNGELLHIKNIARESFKKATGQPYPKNIQQLPAEIVKVAAEHYLSKTAPKTGDFIPQIVRLVDKMPTNFEMLGIIQILFPNAYIIHTTRDPMDTLWSCYQQTLAAKYSYDLDDLADKYQQYRQYMSFWAAQLNLKQLNISYESLVNDIEAGTKNLINFLELEWQPSCLDLQNNQAMTNTASRLQVRKPVYTSSIGAWKPYAKQLKPLYERIKIYYDNQPLEALL